MIEKALQTNAEYQIISVPCHDESVLEYRFSIDQGVIALGDKVAGLETKFVIRDPVEYNVTNMFRDSVIGEAFAIDLDSLLSIPALSFHATHLVGDRLKDYDIMRFYSRIAQRGPHLLLHLCSITGGMISVLSPSVTAFAKE